MPQSVLAICTKPRGPYATHSLRRSVLRLESDAQALGRKIDRNRKVRNNERRLHGCKSLSDRVFRTRSWHLATEQYAEHVDRRRATDRHSNSVTVVLYRAERPVV